MLAGDKVYKENSCAILLFISNGSAQIDQAVVFLHRFVGCGGFALKFVSLAKKYNYLFASFHLLAIFLFDTKRNLAYFFRFVCFEEKKCNKFNIIIVRKTIFSEITENIYTVSLIVNLVLIKGMLIYMHKFLAL